MTTIIGIDPGLSGGIAVIRHGIVMTAVKTPETAKDLFDLLTENDDASAVFIEKVGATPQMGTVSAFKFGQSVGELRMACIAAGLRIEYVTPQKWQKEFGLIVKGRGLGQGDTEKKNRNKARAQELFPKIKCTHAVSDALLIAEFGRRQTKADDPVREPAIPAPA